MQLNQKCEKWRRSGNEARQCYVLIVGEADKSFLLILGKLQTLDVLLQRLKAGGHRYGAKLVRGSTQVKKVQQPRPLHTESPVATEGFNF